MDKAFEEEAGTSYGEEIHGHDESAKKSHGIVA